MKQILGKKVAKNICDGIMVTNIKKDIFKSETKPRTKSSHTGNVFEYRCEYCDYVTTKRFNYKKHCSTRKHLKHIEMGKMSIFDISEAYHCTPCKYSTPYKKHYEQHCNIKTSFYTYETYR